MISVTRKFEICYSHKLSNHKGKCKNLHGHNGIVEIEIGGKLNEDGMVVDFGDLKLNVNEGILDKLDHQHLNPILPIPTAELIVMWIQGRLSPIYGDRLLRIRLWETRDCYAEWRRDGSQ
jgi:6-pyruvoyltetrahydropterin/6-carboxytetrahydropterin synthase